MTRLRLATPRSRRGFTLIEMMIVMAIIVIPVAVSVHTVVSFVFSMTLQPMWHSTIFGPYFVVGAIFSGIAALIIAMLGFGSTVVLSKFVLRRDIVE